jgi:hypothetical protein
LIVSWAIKFVVQVEIVDVGQVSGDSVMTPADARSILMRSK